MLKIRRPSLSNIVETPGSLMELLSGHLENTTLSNEEKLVIVSLVISGYEVGASLDRGASTGVYNDDILRCKDWLYSKFREYSPLRIKS